MRRVDDRRRRSDGSLLDALFNEAGRSLFRTARESFRDALQETVHGAVLKAMMFLLAGALWITASVFLLIAAVEALKAADLHPSLAYLILGVVGGLAGLWIWTSGLKRTGPPA